MNRIRFITLLGTSGVLVLLASSCSQESLSDNPGTGGTSPTGGSGGSSGSVSTGGAGTGAMSGAGGSAGTAGTGGSSGSGAGVGGSSGSAGAAVGGSAGAAVGGSAGMGGSTSGGSAGTGAGTAGAGGSTGGAGAGGSAGSSGGMSGTSGASGAGGTTGGAGAGGGGAGMAGTGGSGTIDTKTFFEPPLDGFYWEGTCSGNVSTSGKNCPIYAAGVTSCPSGTNWDNRGTIKEQSIKAKGTAGQKYTVNFEVRGVAGTRCYTGGMAASSATPSTTNPNNTWYVGGRQANDSIWNTYELHVENPTVSGAANTYFLNAFPSNPDWCQKEATYKIGYTASFQVMGDSTLRFTIHDSNCQAQQNCGPDEASTTCTSPINVDLGGMDPAATFTQPPVNTVGNNNYRPQWLYFDVKTITSP